MKVSSSLFPFIASPHKTGPSTQFAARALTKDPVDGFDPVHRDSPLASLQSLDNQRQDEMEQLAKSFEFVFNGHVAQIKKTFKSEDPSLVEVEQGDPFFPSPCWLVRKHSTDPLKEDVKRSWYTSIQLTGQPGDYTLVLAAAQYKRDYSKNERSWVSLTQSYSLGGLEQANTQLKDLVKQGTLQKQLNALTQTAMSWKDEDHTKTEPIYQQSCSGEVV